jgi:RNA ligase
VFKYPRTPHLEGSRLQPGDEDLAQAPFEQVRGRHLVVEEKLDGANAGISFGPGGELKLQSRGHYLGGGPRERQFTLFKSWAATHTDALRGVLSDRFVLFGEWLYARHTVFYYALPHYFLEFDILDLSTGHFLGTPERHQLLADTPVRSVPVLKAQAFDSLAEVTALLGPSTASTTGVPMEGLYLKVEEQGRVVERYKWIRPEFLQAILESGEHWADRPIEPNQLADPGALYV